MNVSWQQPNQRTQVIADLVAPSPLEVIEYHDDVAGGLNKAVHDRPSRRPERRILSDAPADDPDLRDDFGDRKLEDVRRPGGFQLWDQPIHHAFVDDGLDSVAPLR